MAKRRTVADKLREQLRVASEKALEQAASNGRLTEMAARLDKQNTEKNEAISRNMTEIDRQKDLVKRTEAERDRIIRLVDQFTSIQITPLGTSLNAASVGHASDLPHALRKT